MQNVSQPTNPLVLSDPISDFRQTARLICKAECHAFLCRRRNRCQRPHMAENHIFLILRHFKIFFCIVHRSSRMGETVKALSGHLSVSMPVPSACICGKSDTIPGCSDPGTSSDHAECNVPSTETPDAPECPSHSSNIPHPPHTARERSSRYLPAILSADAVPRQSADSVFRSNSSPYFHLTPEISSHIR